MDRQDRLHGRRPKVKRFAETLLTLATLPLWGTAALAVAAAVRLADGRPVLFRQERAGLRGRPFMLIKFRTMRPDGGGDKERTTRLGRFLRATSLDELPQLLHVLSGRMALVGPRPLPARYLPRYSPLESRRHDVRPGITGWAQVNGRNAISWRRKFALDVWYVRNRSLALDAKILFMTVLRVLRRNGINSSADETMGEFEGGRAYKDGATSARMAASPETLRR